MGSQAIAQVIGSSRFSPNEIASLCLVLVREVDDLPDAALDDHLGALVARKEGDVYGALLDVRRILVQNGIHLGVANVQVLVLQLVRGCLAPWHLLV